MLKPATGEYREIVAALMCSRMYFELALAERLALVKSLCAYQYTVRSLPAQSAGR